MKSYVMKFIVFVLYTVLLFNVAAFSQSGIVQVGDSIYTMNGLISIAKDSAFNPFKLIEKIRVQETKKLLAAGRNLDMSNPEQSLYGNVTGVELGQDSFLIADKSVSLQTKKNALLRRGIYKEWLSGIAKTTVPIKILDYRSFWNQFKKTKTYQVRAEQGYILNPEGSAYSWGDLLVDTAAVVATSNGISFLKGNEYNAFLKNNENTLMQMAKRDKNISQAQTDVAQFIVSEKLLGMERDKNKVQPDSAGIEKQVVNLARVNMMMQDIDLKGINVSTYSDYMQTVNSRRMTAMASKMNYWRSVLKGNTTADPNDYAVTMLGYEAYPDAQATIAKTIGDNDVQGWMQKEQYKGSLPIARMLYAQELLMKHIADLIAQANVQVMIR